MNNCEQKVERSEEELIQFKTSIQELRRYFGDHLEAAPIEVQVLLADTLKLILNADKDLIEAAEGDIMMLLLLLEEREKTHEVIALAKECKLKLIRVLRQEPRILRGQDNTDLYKDKRDAEGYITDLTLLRAPYNIQHVIHRDNPNLQFTEEIYIDSLGRYFRKIYDYIEKEESDAAIADEILSNFE